MRYAWATHTYWREWATRVTSWNSTKPSDTRTKSFQTSNATLKYFEGFIWLSSIVMIFWFRAKNWHKIRYYIVQYINSWKNAFVCFVFKLIYKINVPYYLCLLFIIMIISHPLSKFKERHQTSLARNCRYPFNVCI